MRLLPVAVPVLLLVASGFAGPVLAQDKQAECEAQAKIVARATELRQDRKSQKKTTEMMQAGEDDAVEEKYLAAVPAIVDWVYLLKRKQLKEDPSAAYLEACLAQ
ncbi:MAG: hypothetical protein ACU0A6_17125 [Shimia sp.]|jgi:hypothetical protein|uniref:hypothetical protein n=1 Tax=Shimia sp. TaxID=1954381 RepID=UPI004058BF8B